MIPEPFSISNKIVTSEQLMFHLRGWRAKGFVIGFTNGCFDLLHRGHVAYLEETKKYCSKLVVAVNADESVRSLNKGTNRPVNKDIDRAYVLAGLVFVDYVVVFNEATPLSLIEMVKPDYLFKGGDYDVSVTDPRDPRYIVGSDVVRKNGGQVITIPLVQGFSTTATLGKVQSN